MYTPIHYQTKNLWMVYQGASSKAAASIATRNGFGSDLRKATRKIASTVVIGRSTSGIIVAASLSLLPASLPGLLALPPPRSRRSPEARRSTLVVDLKALFSF
jgi:hypothetical protein